MKTIYFNLIVIALAALAVSCNEDDTLSNTNVSAVTTLYSPTDNTFLNLGASSSALFEWQAAKAEDNGVVLYDVAFDTETGDFSDPVYVMPSDGKGFQSTLNISFTDLNRIAEMAGIEAQSTGKLKWTVLSSKGLNIQKSTAFGIIEVERPAGFPMPDELFLTGTAAEVGDDIANAIPLKKTGATTYEVYTSLQAGDYQLVTRKSGTPESFYISGNDLKSDGSTTYTGDTKVYRIRIDFSDGSVNMVEVEKIELWFPPEGQFLFEFDYAGSGTWQALDKLIEFKQQSWGKDERYKFKFTFKDGDDTIEEGYGSVNADNQRPNADTAESYWYMVPVPESYWDNSFKYDGAVDGKNVDIDIIFNTSVPAYTHQITIL